jgi:hypothetical protein
VDWHLFTLSMVELVARQLVSHLLYTETTPEERACFSVLWEDKVIVIESCCSTYT